MTSKIIKQMPLIALCLGFAMVVIDVTVVNVALPNIGKNLGGGISALQWVVDGYALTFACLLLSAGNLGDRFGARHVFLGGLILFILTSLSCGLAPSFNILNISRLLQGVSAALLIPTSLALINAAYESKQERASAMGVWGGVSGIAAALGPIIGAFLTAWFGWRAVFLVNIPIGIITILLTLKYVPNPQRVNRTGGLDISGQVTAIISIAALAFGLIEAGNSGWSSPTVINSLIIFALTLGIFLIVEQRSKAPMFPLGLFRSKSFSTGIIIGLILNFGFYGVLFLLPFYFQEVRGYSILQTGLAILPLPGLSALASYTGGKVASIRGPKLPMVVGQAIAACGFISLSLADHNATYLALILPLAILGFGCAFNMPAATFTVISSAPENRAGMASGAFNAMRQIGGLLGVAIFGTIINMSTHFISGMQICLIIAAVAFICGCVMSLLFINNNQIMDVPLKNIPME